MNLTNESVLSRSAYVRLSRYNYIEVEMKREGWRGKWVGMGRGFCGRNYHIQLFLNGRSKNRDNRGGWVEISIFLRQIRLARSVLCAHKE